MLALHCLLFGITLLNTVVKVDVVPLDIQSHNYLAHDVHK